MKYSWMLVLPAVVAAAVIWNVSATPAGKCPKVDALDETVLLANLDDCTSFYSCSDGVLILMHCPDGLHFNAKLCTCDWPSDAGCEEVVKEEESKRGWESIGDPDKDCFVHYDGNVTQGVWYYCKEKEGGFENCMDLCAVGYHN